MEDVIKNIFGIIFKNKPKILFIAVFLFLLSAVVLISVARLNTKTTQGKTVKRNLSSLDKKINSANNISSAEAKPHQPNYSNTPVSGSVTTSITQAAVQTGVLSSAKIINQVISYLTTGTRYGACLFVLPQRPDNSIFSASLEIIPQDGSSVYASTSFAPFYGQSSEAVYDTVQYVPKPTDEVRKTIFGNISNESVLKENIIMLDAGNIKVFLMPAGKNGCVVIKKEVVR